MSKHQYTFAAAALAWQYKEQQSLNEQALLTLSADKEKAKTALTEYGATRFQRELYDEGELRQIPGQTLILYKAPLPGEQQAKLSYEYLLGEFKIYLKQKAFSVITSESDAHLGIWLPEGAKLELDDLWQLFIEEMTSPQGLSKGFGLVMNASKLSDRGFSTLETPLVSNAQPLAIAAFYIANLQHVQARISRRESLIDQARKKLENGLDDKERSRIQKQLQKDEDMQEKELTKYRDEFAKMFGRLLSSEFENHKSLQDLEDKLANATAKEMRQIKSQQSKLLASTNFSARTARVLKEAYKPDAFAFMQNLEKNRELGELWKAAKASAKRYTDTAANQLSTQKGDIYAKIIWETCKLLYGENEIVRLEPMLGISPFDWGFRLSGDNQHDSCYSCGKPIDKHSDFPSRRLLFENPEQRTQSGGSGGPVRVCITCAALSVLSPVKFAPDTLVIRMDAASQAIEDRVKQALEQQALNEMGAIAGRYVNISCTEKDNSGTPASQKLGLKQYAIAKLASIYSVNVLRYLQPRLYNGGQEIVLPASVLVATSVLMAVYYQAIKDGSDINMKLGESVRLAEAGEFIKASYVLSRIQKRIISAELENGTRDYLEVLREEQGMHKQRQILEDVHGMIGLLMPFCRQLIARTDLGMDETTKWREVGKLIQSIDINPTIFSYNTGKTVGGVGNLVRDSNTHFVFDKAKELVAKLGDIPAYVDKEGNTENDPNKIRVTNELIAKAFEYIYSQDRYASDYDLKNFFYQVRLGLYARFPDATKARGDK